MNKEELSAMIAQILANLGNEPMVKGSDYKATTPGPQPADYGFAETDVKTTHFTAGTGNPSPTMALVNRFNSPSGS